MSNSQTTLFSPLAHLPALTPAPANNIIVCRPSAAPGSLFAPATIVVKALFVGSAFVQTSSVNSPTSSVPNVQPRIGCRFVCNMGQCFRHICIWWWHSIWYYQVVFGILLTENKRYNLLDLNSFLKLAFLFFLQILSRLQVIFPKS